MENCASIPGNCQVTGVSISSYDPTLGTFDENIGGCEDGTSSDALDELFMNSNSDVEWISLADDLTNDVQDLDLSMGANFMHSNNTQLSATENNTVGYRCLYPNLGIIQETCESSSLDEGDGDNETETLAGTMENISYGAGSRQHGYTKHSKRLATRSSGAFTSRMLSTTLASTSESNNSDSSIQSNNSVQGKRRGGWPKGRKRKPDVTEIRPPKAPSTGYVLFLTDKRKNYKNLPFSEVTRLLGYEWSKLDRLEKKPYLDKAEVDKKRYREELRAYRKSDAYQSYIRWKRTKKRPTNGTEESDLDVTDDVDDEEDNDELYCKACDQWFVTFHNKREHLYGKHHMGTVRNKRRISRNTGSNDGSSSYSLDESSVENTPLPSPRHTPKLATDLPDPCTPSIDESIAEVMSNYAEREREINFLKEKIEETKEKQLQIKSKITDYTLRKEQLSKTLDRLEKEAEDTESATRIYCNLKDLFCS